MAAGVAAGVGEHVSVIFPGGVRALSPATELGPGTALACLTRPGDRTSRRTAASNLLPNDVPILRGFPGC